MMDLMDVAEAARTQSSELMGSGHPNDLASLVKLVSLLVGGLTGDPKLAVPLSRIAPRKGGWSGIVRIRKSTLIEPALSPNIVTLSGSAMLS
jgi:hypothetical protein